MDLNDVPKVGLCGFQNIGNTCYLNSILQLLIHSNVFLSFVLNDDFNNYLEKASIQRIADIYRKQNNLTENQQITIKKSDIEKLSNLSIIKKLHDIVDTIINKGNSIINPQSLKEIVDIKIKSFRGFMQQDGHEFLLQILDNIIEETGIETEPMLNNVPEIIKNYKDIIAITKKKIIETNDINEKKNIINNFNNYKLQNKDIINKYEGLTYMRNIFKKKHNPFIFNIKNITINNIVCSNCNNLIVNYENNTILSLPISDSLYNSFKMFTNTEEINDYNCSVCNSSQKIFKNLKIWKAPILLFIHLKRFKQLDNGKVKKDNSFVDIPMELDITDFYDSSIYDNTKLKYKLKGFVNHHGGLNGGHYTSDCACINDESWYHFDDSNVSKYTGYNVDISSAYILMYEILN